MKALTAVVVIAVAASTASAERDPAHLLAEAAARSNAGDHPAAIALYEQAYAQSADPELLPIIASEYRRAGALADAMEVFCDYLKAHPKAEQAPFAATQVIAIHAELGQTFPRGRICEPPAPVRIDFAPRRPVRAPKPGMSNRELAGIATVAAGLAGLGASLYFNARARDISNDISAHDPATPWPADIRALEERGQRFEDRAKWLAIAGGAALVTGGILYFTGRSDRRAEEKLLVAPTVSATGGGISLTRGF